MYPRGKSQLRRAGRRKPQHHRTKNHSSPVPGFLQSCLQSQHRKLTHKARTGPLKPREAPPGTGLETLIRHCTEPQVRASLKMGSVCMHSSGEQIQQGSLLTISICSSRAVMLSGTLL